jgi:hypothetical protein
MAALRVAAGERLPRVPKNLSPLVPTYTHSPKHMYPAFSLVCIINEDGTDYSEKSISKHQQRRVTSRKSESLHISGIYKLYSRFTWCNEKKNKLPE